MTQTDRAGDWSDATDWECYKHVREEIAREWTLITSRIGWLVTSQAFLFTALVVSAPAQPITYSALFPLLPLIGLGASLSVFVSVVAALRRIRHLRRSQWTLVKPLPCEPGASAGSADSNSPEIGLCSWWARFLGDCWMSIVQRLRRLPSKLAETFTGKAGTSAGSADSNTSKIALCPSSPRIHFFGAVPTFFVPMSLFLAWAHVLGETGVERVLDWLDFSKANAVVYLLVVGVALGFWGREVFGEARDWQGNRPAANPADTGARRAGGSDEPRTGGS